MIFNIDNNEGDRLFLMAMSQSFYEPLKIGLLEKAVVEHNNILSALVLADLYNSGIERDGKKLVKKSSEKAAEIYLKMCEHDPFGVCYWELGWFYENQLINQAKELELSECLAIARNYYEKSAEKRYPKAYNSLGKFTYYGFGGLNKSFVKAMHYYIKAAELGDIYAIMNCGLISLDRYYDNPDKKEWLEEAEKYFIKAALYNNSEGLLQLGIIYEIKMAEDANHLEKAKEYYIKAFLTVENQYSATAYYKLGKLINNHPDLKNDDEIIMALGDRRYQDLAIECLTRAYEIYQNLDLNNERLDSIYKENYLEMVNIFKNMN